MTSLPIDEHLPAIVAAAREKRSLVLVAPPGAGKTTRVPPAILRAGLLSAEHPNLVMLQPRRVAARAAAGRIADENGWQIGREVGYQIRFENRIGPHTRLRVITEGILTRQLLDDPFLEGVGAVLLDEFHERSLHTDLAIALLREIRQTVREDLILIVMSATLEAGPVSRFLGDCPIIQTRGRAHPVEIVYAHAVAFGQSRELPEHVARAISDVLNEPGGEAAEKAQPPGPPLQVGMGSHRSSDVLIFLPGVEEIRRTMDRLAPFAARENLLLLPLHGSLSGEEQAAALRPADRRKVILATNIAETSLTIDGVHTVIDSGLARVAGYDARRGLDRLELARISKASATQRAGRAGRTGPGRCIRLWTVREEQAMSEFEQPEIQRVDLCATVLMLHAWGRNDPRAFGWYEPPSESTLAAAERLLAMLGALTSETDGRITPIGKRLVTLPVHPRLGRLLIAAADDGLLREGATIAALLSEKDIVSHDWRDPSDLHQRSVQASSDLLLRLDLLARAEQDRFGGACRSLGIDIGAARQVARVRDELERVGSRITRSRPAGSSPAHARGARDSRASRDSRDSHEQAPPESNADEDDLLKLALLAYPDRVARRRGADPNAAVMVGGTGVRLAAESAVRQAEFFVALDARHDPRQIARQAVVRIASAIQVEWLEELFPQSIRRERGVMFDEARQCVVGFTAIHYRDLLLREDRNAAVDPEEAARVLAQAVRPVAGEFFAANEAARSWLARLNLLRQAMPEHPWPEFSQVQLADLLEFAASGKKSVEELKRVPLVPLLLGALAFPLDRVFEECAPESIEVPTGNRIRLDYTGGPQPILAVRLQELFGWTQTPRIAQGRVPVVLHLLGPNFRPVQITQDLASFWSSAYFQVRKDLRIRYPKHSWPEDPLTATPQARGRGRNPKSETRNPK